MLDVRRNQKRLKDLKVEELLGRSIIDIQVKQVQEPYGLDVSESYFILDNGPKVSYVCNPVEVKISDNGNKHVS